MSEEFDEIARIVASQVPRRQAIRLIVGGLVSGSLASLGLNLAVAQTPNEKCNPSPMRPGPLMGCAPKPKCKGKCEEQTNAFGDVVGCGQGTCSSDCKCTLEESKGKSGKQVCVCGS